MGGAKFTDLSKIAPLNNGLDMKNTDKLTCFKRIRASKWLIYSDFRHFQQLLTSIQLNNPDNGIDIATNYQWFFGSTTEMRCVMKKKILIVDDDADFIDAVSTILRASSYEVVSGSNPMECFEMLVKEKPDLIILDIMMDNLFDGFSVCNRIKTSEEYKEFRKVPIIHVSVVKDVTGSRFSFDPEEMGFVPADAYLDKPVKPTLLLETVASLTGKAGEAKDAEVRQGLS